MLVTVQNERLTFKMEGKQIVCAHLNADPIARKTTVSLLKG
jgi:hypothetical protein